MCLHSYDKEFVYIATMSTSQQQEPRVIHGAGIVVCRKKRTGTEFLLLKAKWGRHWSLPKGHKDKKETSVITTALRETQEETGFSQDVIQLLDTKGTDVSYKIAKPTKNCPDGIKNVRMFVGVVSESEKVRLSREHTDFLWARYPSASHLLPDEFTPLLSDALEMVG